MTKGTGKCVLALAATAVALLLQGCGGGAAIGYIGYSRVGGTVSDIDRNVIVGATVWADADHETESLTSGAYALDGVESGWTTIRASAVVNGETWVGSTAAEVLWDEPTMNINIVLAPRRETTEIGGIVRDDNGYRESGARVLLTTRIVYPYEDTSSFDGPYGSIVAVTDRNGSYLLEDVPVGLSATIAASKVGFRNREFEIDTIAPGMVVNFSLVESNLIYSPDVPILEAIESYTMPDAVTRSDLDAYKAIRAFTSPRFREAVRHQNQVLTRATPPGSLMEIDLYWNALDVNDSRDMAGYGIYRTTSPAVEMRAIDFVRDPYANFYGDMGLEITPDQTYYYAVTSVDVEFLDHHNNPDPAAESNLSNTLSVMPLGQLQAVGPAQGTSVSGDPTFTWARLSGASSYSVYVYDRFPALPLDPAYDYGSDPAVDAGVFPLWPSKDDPNESTVGGGATSIGYTGPALTPGHDYYWVILAADGAGAYSYSQLRHFTTR